MEYSLALKDNEITTKRYYYTPTKMFNMNKTDHLRLTKRGIGTHVHCF